MGGPVSRKQGDYSPRERNIMSAELHRLDTNEDKLVHLYQDIMQCEEEHANSVWVLLSEVMTEKPAIALISHQRSDS